MAQLESGKPHSLKEIFCGENDKIIVPDLQRDFVGVIIFLPIQPKHW